MAGNIESTTTNGVITRSHTLARATIIRFGGNHLPGPLSAIDYSVLGILVGTIWVITHSHPLKLLLFGLEVIFTRATVCNKQSAYMVGAGNFGRKLQATISDSPIS